MSKEQLSFSCSSSFKFCSLTLALYLFFVFINNVSPYLLSVFINKCFSPFLKGQKGAFESGTAQLLNFVEQKFSIYENVA